jgi:hypothetical protein
VEKVKVLGWTEFDYVCLDIVHGSLLTMDSRCWDYLSSFQNRPAMRFYPATELNMFRLDIDHISCTFFTS